MSRGGPGSGETNIRDRRALELRYARDIRPLTPVDGTRFGPFPLPSTPYLDRGEPQLLLSPSCVFWWTAFVDRTALQTFTFETRIHLEILAPRVLRAPRVELPGSRVIDLTTDTLFAAVDLAHGLGAGYVSVHVIQTGGPPIGQVEIQAAYAIIPRPAEVYRKDMAGQQPPYGIAPVLATLGGSG